ncbi:hypothetical protein BD311DRAFT_867100 [Dichomitus squalens]|uniref:Pentacotripeptide-repeat region of PRORP domain-containing protein n=1 Tax=Dichomitus squalens TaxID=114155 RepID=A0A4Q9MF47_9APHY|nr:hypothetical protein BD311DRAFT_867100 [Dichomitus squalens]
MFLCRHQLLRAPAQRHFASLLTKRHAPAVAAIPEPTSPRHAHCASSRPVIDGAPPGRTNTADTNAPSHSSRTAGHLPEIQDHEDSSSRNLHTRRSSRLPRMSDEEFSHRPICNYIRLRKFGIPGFQQLTAKRFGLVVNDALRGRWAGPDIFSDLVEDAIHVCERQNVLKGRFVITLVLRKLAIAQAITKTQILQLLRTLEAHDGLRFVPTESRIFIARAVAAYPPDQTIDGELFGLLAPWLLRALPEKPAPSTDKPGLWEESSTGTRVPRVLWAIYRGILSLAQSREQTGASNLLAKLVAGSHVGNDAINATNLSEKDYIYIVLSVLVRTCLSHGWVSRAAELLMPEVSARESLSPALAQLLQDWVAAALGDPREQDLKPAAHALILLFQRAEKFQASTAVVQEFYDAAFRAKMPEVVESVYRAARKIETYPYPPPRGQALLYFMRYLLQNSRNVHLARLLAQQIVEEDIPLPPTVRGDFISNIAVFGFTSYARALWERYSTGPDMLYVVGRRAVMLRLVSAFLKAEAIVMRTVRQRWPSEPTVAPRINQLDEAARRVDDQDEDVQASSSETRPDDRVEEDHPASDAPHPAASPPPHGIADEDAELVSGLSSDADDLAAPTGEDGSGRRPLGFAALTRSELLERAGDLRRFAERVFDAYVACKPPLEALDHYGLNALARGAFMLGRDQMAFEVFSAMKKRGIKLDMYDVNVALSVVAKADPAAGFARIRRMLASGFKPDAATYGTVIHWAVYHGDAPLVGEVLRFARANGLKNFSFKTMGSLLHATVSSQFDSLTTPGAQLDNARGIVDNMFDVGILPTVNMGRDCVIAALRAEDPVMAFSFWKQLLRGKVQYTDPAQAALRRRIVYQIREHYSSGWLDEKRARAMLSELGYPSELPLHVKQRLGPGAPEIDDAGPLSAQ